MNRKLKLIALFATVSAIAWGASIDHIQTYSPEYLGNQAQNGMINNSSVYFNPAGTTRLKSGTYFQVGGQLALGYEKMNYGGKDFKAKLVQPIPNVAVFKVNDKGSTFLTFGALGGGGDLKYKHGVPGTAVIPDLVNTLNAIMPQIVEAKTQGKIKGLLAIPITNLRDNGSSAEGSSLYIQTTLGHAWNVNDKLSVSLAGRVVYGRKTLKANLKLKGTALKGKELAKQLEEESQLEIGKLVTGGTQMAIAKIPNFSEMPKQKQLAMKQQISQKVENKIMQEFAAMQNQNLSQTQLLKMQQSSDKKTAMLARATYLANAVADADETSKKIDKFANDINTSIDGTRTAWGYGVQLGVNYRATKRLNLAMRYDSRVKMNFKAKGSQKDVNQPLLGLNIGFGSFYPEYENGMKVRRDLPAILALGASYKMTDNLTMGLSGNYYFNKNAKMDRIAGHGTLLGQSVNGIKPKYDNGYELS